VGFTTRLASVATEEGQRPLREIVNGGDADTIPRLNRLRDATRPEVLAIMAEIQRAHGLRSEISDKRPATARAKVRRPATLVRYPWFTLAHLRDYLRFRTHLARVEDFVDIARYFVGLQQQGRVSLVKIDGAKLFSPGVFGWRMVAFDLRIIKTGMIVEHYMTFSDLIMTNDRWLHRVFEAWRDEDTDTMSLARLADFERDALLSRHANREFVFDAVAAGDPASAGNRSKTQDALLAAFAARLSAR
jgi:hypothetical protein